MDQKTDAPLLLSQSRDGVLTLTLNRPEARNALSCGLINALQDALDAAAKDADVRVIILAAKGTCLLRRPRPQGNDRAPGRSRSRRAATSATCSPQCSDADADHRAPPQAGHRPGAGRGHGGGLPAGGACDLAVASTNAQFATPGVNIGLFCSTPMVALSRNVPRKQAMEMLLTGDHVDAETARIGLVNRVVAPEKLEAETMALARQIAAKPRATVKIGKEAFYRQLEMRLERCLRLCERDHDAQHAARRSPGRHRRLRGKARTQMAAIA